MTAQAIRGSAAAVAGVGDLIVGVGMDDERGAIAVEQRGDARGQGDPVGLRIQAALALRVDHEVRQVAGVRPVRVLQAVLTDKRVVVSAGAGEGRADARPDGMDVDPVQPGREPIDLDIHVDEPLRVLDQVDRPDLRSCCVDEGAIGVARSRRPGGDGRREQDGEGAPGDQGDASAGGRHGRHHRASLYRCMV